MSESPGNTAPSSRRLAGGAGWSLSELVCRSGPGDRPYEERHGGVSLSAVVSGAFTYRSEAGKALLHPGALLLGNHGACFQCGHEHGVGDRCISVRFSPDYFGEVAATAAGSARYRFPVAMLSPGRTFLPHAVRLEALGGQRDPLRVEEQLVGFVAAALRALSGSALAAQHVSARDERRVGRAVRHIEAHFAEPLDLDRLAAVATTSKFHFLRIFRRTVGLTPHQFVLSARLRRAALDLLSTPRPISVIAYDSGFGDLSTFNAAFRERFAAAPRSFRRNGGPQPAAVPGLQ